MGLNDENLPQRIVLDIETAPIADAADYLEPVEAPSNYKDPLKIAAYQEEARAGQLGKAALDQDLCRVVALGLKNGAGPVTRVAPTETEEREVLADFWDLFGRAHFIGYNILAFDLPVLLRRSLYLGIKAPALQLDKYRHPFVTDLMLVLSNHGAQRMRSLAFYCKRFGLSALEGNGAEIPALVAAGDWAGVEKHLVSDVEATAALAARLNVL
jgi:hypothetical protein